MFFTEKIWICGSSGRVGSALRFLLDPRDSEIISTDIEEVDVTNLQDVLLFGERNYPQFIINCTGMNDVDQCAENPEEAFRINALGARNLAVVANHVDATLVQISTDDVFSGRAQTPINELAIPDPQSTYGQSKLAGENYVRELTHKHYIVRSSWLYGKSLLQYIINEAEKNGVFYAAEGYVGTPTSSLELGHFLIALMSSHAYGTYHASCEGQATRKEYYEAILRNAGVHAEVLEKHADVTLSKYRPSYAVLDNFIMRISDLYTMPHWEHALKTFMADRF